MAEVWFSIPFGMTLGSVLTVLFLRWRKRRPARQWRVSAKAPQATQRVRKNTSPGVTRVTKARFKVRGRRSW